MHAHIRARIPQERNQTQQQTHTHAHTPPALVFWELFRQVEQRSVSFISSVNKSSCGGLLAKSSRDFMNFFFCHFVCICMGVCARECSVGRREDRIRRRGAHQRMSSREPAESRQVADETKAPCKQSAGNRTVVNVFFLHLVVLHKTQGSRMSDILAASYVSDQQSENQSHLVSVSGSTEGETQSNTGKKL